MVPLPKCWSNFLALPENKADLARFLSEELLRQTPEDKEIVTVGGFINEMLAQSSKYYTDILSLSADHEEADTRLALRANNATCHTVVVAARDTDVLIILVSQCERMQCNDLWMMSGTSKKRKFIPVKEILNALPQRDLFEHSSPFTHLQDVIQLRTCLGIQRHLHGKILKSRMNSCKIWEKEVLTSKLYGKQNNFFATFMVQVTSTPQMTPDTSYFSRK